MRTDSGRTTSIWMATADTGVQPRLQEDLEVDVCVVGAGIAGVTAAYLLAKEGKRVALLDDGPISGGETARTTAHLAWYIDDGMTRVESQHGFDHMKLAAEAHLTAIDRIDDTARREKIDCDFQRVPAYLWPTSEGDGPDFLERELDACRRAGFADTEWVDRAPLPFDTGRCLRFGRHGQFHPLKYLAGLVQAVWKLGGRVYADTHAQSIEGGSPTARVTVAGGHKVTAAAVVVTTNSPVNDRVTIHTKQAPYRTYVVGVRVPKGSVPPGLYWDTEDPYHYVRTQPDADGQHDVLIVGGEDHKTAHAADPDLRYGRLEQWTRRRFPMAQERVFHWSGQVMETADYLSFTGRNPNDADNVFIHTGDSGMGMTHGTLAGILLTDLILGRPNPWEKVFHPSRIGTQSKTEWVKENLDVAAQYRDFVTPGQVDSVTEIAPRQGAIIRRGLTKVAVYRDENDQLHEMSAICPHMGCVVRWNPAEGSWDCPCHGSRFDALGKVVNGPANSHLPPVES